MRAFLPAAIGVFLLGQSALAAPTWTLISFTAVPENAPAVVAAIDELMSSETGKTFPGRLLLQVRVADGADPATHSVVPIYKSAADREAFVEKLQADPAWGEFQERMTELAQPVATAVYRTLKSYGNVSDDDHVWHGHAFTVSDPEAFVTALDAFMGSETGKKFPGQAHLSGTVAAGLTPVTHVITVGYASEAEMETWVDGLQANADWAAYLDAAGAAADYLGANLTRDVKTWGEASLADLTAAR